MSRKIKVADVLDLRRLFEHPGFHCIERKEVALERGEPNKQTMVAPVTKWGERWEIGVQTKPEWPEVRWVDGTSLSSALDAARLKGWIRK